MTPIFKVDNVAYNVFVPESGLKRTGSILDGKNAGRVISGDMVRDLIGTYYNYTLQLETQGLDAKSYDSLYEVLTAPVDYHTIVLPYGQGALTFRAYISNVEDTLHMVRKGTNVWGSMTVNFVAMGPQRRRGG